jgi:hypothetical protein
MNRPKKKITRKTIMMNNRMKELELKEKTSKSLLANVLDIDEDFRYVIPCIFYHGWRQLCTSGSDFESFSGSGSGALNFDQPTFYTTKTFSSQNLAMHLFGELQSYLHNACIHLKGTVKSQFLCPRKWIRPLGLLGGGHSKV